jgi:prepilin-type N-terminal cleavage/methylation domain-containing protein
MALRPKKSDRAAPRGAFRCLRPVGPMNPLKTMLRPCANLARRSAGSRRTSPLRAAAFTMAEMVVVLAVVAIMAAVAIPMFGSSISHNRLDAAARRVRLDLDLARDLARRTSQSVRVRFSLGSNLYLFVGVPDVDRPSQAYQVELAREPYRVTLEVVDLGGDADVVFDGFGTPDSGGVVVLRCGPNTKVITLEAVTGVAAIQ